MGTQVRSCPGAPAIIAVRYHSEGTWGAGFCEEYKAFWDPVNATSSAARSVRSSSWMPCHVAWSMRPVCKLETRTICGNDSSEMPSCDAMRVHAWTNCARGSAARSTRGGRQCGTYSGIAIKQSVFVPLIFHPCKEHERMQSVERCRGSFPRDEALSVHAISHLRYENFREERTFAI